MRAFKAIILIAGIAGLLALAGCASAPANSLASHNPSTWAKDIAAFQAGDLTNPAPRGCIVFTGSSYIRRWTTIAQDFPGMQAVNRGFGGCQLTDVYAYADRIIIPYAPREVVI